MSHAQLGEHKSESTRIVGDSERIREAVSKEFDAGLLG